MNYKRLIKIEADEGQVPAKINVLNAGKFNTTKYGPMTISTEMLQQMVENFDRQLRAGETLPIDAEHYSDQGAYGWISSLELSDANTRLWANVDWNPWGIEALSNKIYKFFSPEFADVYRDPETSEPTENVLLGGGLTNRPLFRSLNPIMANDEDQKEIIYLREEIMSKKKASEEVEAPVEEPKEANDIKGAQESENDSMEEEINEIADAFGEAPNNPFKNQWYGYRIVGTYDDHIIVVADPDCDSSDWGDLAHVKYFQVNFTEDETAETYIFEDPMPVKPDFVAQPEEIEMVKMYNEEMIMKKASEKDVKKADEVIEEPKAEEKIEEPVAPVETPATEVAPVVEEPKVEEKPEEKKEEAPVEAPAVEEPIVAPVEAPVEAPVVEKVEAPVVEASAEFSAEQLKALEMRGTTNIKCRDGVMRKIKDGKIVASEEDKTEEPKVEAPAEEVKVAVEGTQETISASELKSLRQAKEILDEKEASEKIEGLVFNEKEGYKLPTESKDAMVSFYKKLNESMRDEFTAILATLPSAKIFTEVGDSGEEQKPDVAYAKMGEIRDAIMAKEGINSGEAFKKARKENPELAKLADEYKTARKTN